MSRVIECAHCGSARPHKSRGLCGTCYRRLRYADQLVDFPVSRDFSMDVDEVQVDRAVDWMVAHACLPWAERAENRATRPCLTRGERIAVLERALHLMPRWAAIEALGISGHYASRYLEAVAS